LALYRRGRGQLYVASWETAGTGTGAATTKNGTCAPSSVAEMVTLLSAVAVAVSSLRPSGRAEARDCQD
jgi:hypothetical protein